MSRSTVRGGIRTWGAVAASLGLLAAGAAVLGTAPSAVSAAPGGDCKMAYPVDDLEVGDAVDGLTVTRGTAPEPFTGEVLGVLDDGIAVDLDMVMVELEMPEFARTGGIWQGMSGSPVYAANGDLIGAVAYGLSWGPSPIAGVTPFEEMDNYLTTAPAPAPRVKVDRSTARTIARRTDVTVAQAEGGFTQLRMPMGISGLSSKRLEKAAGVDKPYAPKGAYGIGRPAPAAAGSETIVAGGNLAASVSHGDVTMAGVGTATSVCDGKVVGFGHPLAFLGRTSMSLHPAEALFVQPESLGAPFKVANLGTPVGAITQDRLAGITGFLGDAPDAADITSAVDYDGRSRVGATHVTVPTYTANAVFGQFLANHDRVLDGIVAGSELQEWTIEGIRPNGTAFSLTYTDRFTSAEDITWSSVFELADLVWSLAAIPGVTVTSVDMGSDVTDETGVWKLASVEQRRSGTWKKITKKSPAVARAGKRVRLRTVLSGPGGTKTVPVQFAVPRRARAARTVYLSVTGGNHLYSDSWVRSVKEAEEMIKASVRNDQIRVEFGTPDRLRFDGGYDEDFDFAPRRLSFGRSRLLGPLDKVVEGSKLLRVRVR